MLYVFVTEHLMDACSLTLASISEKGTRLICCRCDSCIT